MFAQLDVRKIWICLLCGSEAVTGGIQLICLFSTYCGLVSGSPTWKRCVHSMALMCSAIVYSRAGFSPPSKYRPWSRIPHTYRRVLARAVAPWVVFGSASTNPLAKICWWNFTRVLNSLIVTIALIITSPRIHTRKSTSFSTCFHGYKYGCQYFMDAYGYS